MSGTVLEAGGAPVAAATVRATGPAGAAASTLSDARGRYRLVLPTASGAYHLRAERVGYYAFGTDVEVAGGAELRQDFRLTPREVALPPVRARVPAPLTRPPASPTPGGNEEGRLATFDADLPIPPGDLEYLAGMHPGVVRLGDGRISVAGQPSSQTSVTLDGASFGAASLPADALRSTAVVTSTWDPSRGQFSGGQIAASTVSGTDLFGGAGRVRVEGTGQPGGAGPGAAGALAEAGGGAGGALVRHRLYAYGALQGSIRSTPLVTLGTASAGALRALGVSADDRDRLRALAAGAGYPPRPGAAPSDQTASRAAALVRLDYRITDRQVAMLRLDARGTRLGGVGESALALAGSGGELRERSGGAMAQLTSYFAGGRNELRVYASRGDRRFAPYGAGPAAAVRLGDPSAQDGASRTVRFGGSALAVPRTGAALLEAQDEAVLDGGRLGGRFKVGALLNLDRATLRGALDPGTFAFNSLADLEAGRPAAYTRTLDAREGALDALSGAVYAAQLLRPRRGLSLIYGVRGELRAYTGAARGPRVFGLSPGAIAREWGVSPRFGFTWEGREWSLRGGAGEFLGRLPAALLVEPAGETGNGGARTLVCVGPAAPAPAWTRYASEPSALPSACAGGTGAFGASNPPVTVFAQGFAAPRTWRAGLGGGWGRTVRGIGNFTVTLDAAWLRGWAQPVASDANLAGVPGFTLADEGGRAVFVSPAEVDPATGSVAPAAGRRIGTLGTVRRIGGGGRSDVAQLVAGVSLLTPRLDLVGLSWTWTRAVDRVGPLAAPGADSEPLAAAPGALARGAGDLERRQVVQLHWSRPVHPLPLMLGVAAVLSSGAPYTPRVLGDVDGDGVANDAAFVFDPAAAADPALAAAMARVLEHAPRGARDCLRRQLGRVAARNSCRAGWSAGVDLQASLWPALGTTSVRRFTLTVTASNVVAGVDRLVHGAGRMHGWGDDSAPDATLLAVHGFDAAARAFRYEVNPGFGRTLGGAGARPFTLTLQGRWTVGADPVRQPLRSAFNAMQAQGRSAAEVRGELARTIPNPPAQVLTLAGSLRLSLAPSQVGRLRGGADSLGRALAPLADSLAQALATAGNSPDPSVAAAARDRVNALSRQAQAALDAAVEGVRAVLTREQWNALPLEVRQPSRQLLPPHSFTIRTGEDW